MDQYPDRIVDVAFWRPHIDVVATEHGLRFDAVSVGEPGTFPTFILDQSHVVKFFGVPFDGLRCWAVEREVANILGDANVALSIPELLAAGVLSRDPDWNYTITTFQDGEPFAKVIDQLDASTRIQVARDLGAMVRSLHDVVVPNGTVFGDGRSQWGAFVERQQHGIEERHRRWKSLPERLAAHVDGYVADYRAPGEITLSLVHADLHAPHLFGEMTGEAGWEIHGVIDWGDAQVGDRFYELPALHLGLFHGDKAMLAAFLESYGWVDYRYDAFVRRAMTMTLLHEFNVLSKAFAMVDLGEMESLDQLANAIWRV